MITTTLEAIYSTGIEADSDHVIYIIREGEMVLYVGQSKNVVKRIRSHQNDALRRYMDEHWPQALDWRVDLCTIADCQTLLRWQHDQATINDYEWLLIRQLEPTLNVVGSSVLWPHESENALRIRSLSAQPSELDGIAHFFHEVIYVLEDPRDHAIRYVGRTGRSVTQRLTEHITVSYMRNVDLVAWIAELKELDLLPNLRVIDWAPDKVQAIEREKLWIRWYLYRGEPLLNRPMGPTGQWKYTHRPPLILPLPIEEKLLQLAATTGERPMALIERLLHGELDRAEATADNLSGVD